MADTKKRVVARKPQRVDIKPMIYAGRFPVPKSYPHHLLPSESIQTLDDEAILDAAMRILEEQREGNRTISDDIRYVQVEQHFASHRIMHAGNNPFIDFVEYHSEIEYFGSKKAAIDFLESAGILTHEGEFTAFYKEPR